MTGAPVSRSLWHPPAEDPRFWSVARLAYIGDAVYELYVRMMLVSRTAKPTGALHAASVGIVSAQAQADAFERIKTHLSEDELAVAKRGRNAKPHSMPKHADQAVYRTATGFEALLGFLYAGGHDVRLAEIINIVLEDDSHGGNTATQTEAGRGPQTDGI